MCRDVAHGGSRCARAVPLPGAPASAAQRALTRAENTAAAVRDEAAQEYTAALDALFTAVAEADERGTPEDLARALGGWMEAVGSAWVRLCRALERLHARRLTALDARFAAHLAGELEAARQARYARERAELEHLRAAELVLAEVEFTATVPDWSDSLWHPVQQAGLDTVATELGFEVDKVTVLARRAERPPPDPRVISELRAGRARVKCWTVTLQRQQATLDGLPKTPAEADEAVAAARADVDDARARVALTDDERAYLTRPELVAAVEHSRHHPAQRREQPARP